MQNFSSQKLPLLGMALALALTGCHSTSDSAANDSAGSNNTVAAADTEITNIKNDKSLPDTVKAQKIAQIESWKKQQSQSK